MNTIIKRSALAIAVAGACLSAGLSQASSHREAPFITEVPKVDGTDFYMFRSYETGREGYVTLIANYLPLQDAYGGPNYFDLDEDAIYEIHIDNDGDAVEDITFSFNFKDVKQDVALPINDANVSIPLITAAPLGPDAAADAANPNLQVRQTYSVDVVRGDRRTGARQSITTGGGETQFNKPTDNIGSKTIADYPDYADSHITDINVPGCSAGGRVFAGQRAEAFAVNLGAVFDLINLEPGDVTGANGRDLGLNVLADANVTSLAIEVPISCLTNGDDPVIGAWTTASLPQFRALNPAPMKFEESDMGQGVAVEGGAYTQVSRLGSPLVNEVVIGLRDKDRFNASEPKDDATNFLTYVTKPTLAALIESLFGVKAPTVPVREDLKLAFLAGVPGLNAPVNLTQPGEMLRLNTNIEPIPSGNQNDLGIFEQSSPGMGPVNADLAAFPNGRRPVDDVVDIALQTIMGALYSDRFNGVLPVFDNLNSADAESSDIAFTDGAVVDRSKLLESFPYLGYPISGSRTQNP